MTEKQMLLRDPAIKPTENLIFSGLGKATDSFKTFLSGSKKQGITLMDWRFYNDGKAWLTKGEYKWITKRGTTKVKPIFWLSIWEGFFKVSFNFKEESRGELLKLPLSKSTKEIIKNTPTNGNKMKYIAIIFDVDHENQLADIYEIAEFRKQNI